MQHRARLCVCLFWTNCRDTQAFIGVFAAEQRRTSSSRLHRSCRMIASVLQAQQLLPRSYLPRVDESQWESAWQPLPSTAFLSFSTRASSSTLKAQHNALCLNKSARFLFQWHQRLSQSRNSRTTKAEGSRNPWRNTTERASAAE